MKILLTLCIGLSLILILSNDALSQRRGDKCTYPGISEQYDSQIKWAVRKFQSEPLRGHWCILKTICQIESRLKPDAKSGAGATGLCQVMGPTERHVRRKVYKGYQPRSHDLRNVKYNLSVSALVFQNKWNTWISKRTNECRLELGVASYNAGQFSIIRAQAKSGGQRCWEQISHFLNEVTGKKHSIETINYVRRFWETYRRLKYGDAL